MIFHRKALQCISPKLHKHYRDKMKRREPHVYTVSVKAFSCCSIGGKKKELASLIISMIKVSNRMGRVSTDHSFFRNVLFLKEV